MAKHPLEQPTTAAKHPPGATTAAKHPLNRNGGKASASEENPTTKRDPDDADELKRRQAQKQRISEESRPPPAKLPRQRLQEGNDTTGAAAVRPKWSRFSPGRQAGEGGKGRKDDAFKKVNDA